MRALAGGRHQAALKVFPFFIIFLTFLLLGGPTNAAADLIAPTNLEIVDGVAGLEIELAWYASSSGDVVGYFVYYGTDPGSHSLLFYLA
jgi:hypothetical protein